MGLAGSNASLWDFRHSGQRRGAKTLWKGICSKRHASCVPCECCHRSQWTASCPLRLYRSSLTGAQHAVLDESFRQPSPQALRNVEHSKQEIAASATLSLNVDSWSRSGHPWNRHHRLCDLCRPWASGTLPGVGGDEVLENSARCPG